MTPDNLSELNTQESRLMSQMDAVDLICLTALARIAEEDGTNAN